MDKSEVNVVEAKPGMYLWELPGKPIAIYLSLEVVDRLSQDVMRGFGAVPKRGAEVGGILIGKVIPGATPVVEISDFELVPIEYRRGPSYLLSDSDRAAFEEVFSRRRRVGEQANGYAVGFFRSHTREAVGLSEEDIELMDYLLPGPDKVVLVIHPYATRVATAGFYFREDGKFQEGPPPGEFNFRRKEMGAGEPAPENVRRMPLAERPPDRVAPASAQASEAIPARAVEPPPPEPPSSVEDVFVEGDLKSKSKSSWVWLPLSFIFLLLGVLLGFQAALTLRPQTPPGDPFSVGLSVSREGQNLNVRWDRQAPAIRAATQGVLIIDEDTSSRPVYLSSGQLQTGSVVYPHNKGDIKFRLELTLKARDIMMETLDWKE